jgi:hypothetical protein
MEAIVFGILFVIGVFVLGDLVGIPGLDGLFIK